MRLGLFGGTFDPPHLGHLILAAEALYQLNLDRILWILTPFPPHKKSQKISPLSVRLELLAPVIDSDPGFLLSTVDIERDPPHYAVDTMGYLRKIYPEDTLVYLLGADSLQDLPAWYHPRQFLNACDGLGVMRRPGDAVDLAPLEKVLPGIGEKVQMVEAPLLEISSRQIREAVREGRPFRYYLPAEVYRLIIEKKYYQDRVND